MNRRANVARAASLLLAILTVFAAEAAGQPSAQYRPPDDIAFRTASVTSDGTRIHAEVFALRELDGERLPTIIQAHGWGGTAAALRNDAIDFARAGYRVVNFDYRGWGESDARVILTAPAPDMEGLTFTAEVQKIERVVDPIDQTGDWFSVIHWAMAEPGIDPDRIGIRGTSLSGGHVVYVAAWEPRVRAVVSQVPATEPWTAMPQAFATAFDEATRRARGEIGFPPPGVRQFGLTGAPVYEKFVRYSPNAVAHLVRAPTRFVVAENEELFNNEPQAKLAYDRMTAPKDYAVIPEIAHYAVYTTARAQAMALALDWFDRFVK